VDQAVLALPRGAVSRREGAEALFPWLRYLDLAAVSFMDASGLGGFVRIRKALPPDCPVVIRSPQRRVRQLFKITGLDSVIAFE
jgi:anti-anti-sigma factor